LWPVHVVIADAGHLNCINKDDFTTQLKAALESNQTAKVK
jgi:hypothetical protein